jgi:hypothetical protein
MKYALISQRQMIEIESAFETKRLFATVKDIETIDKALKILHLLKFSDAVEITGAELAKPERWFQQFGDAPPRQDERERIKQEYNPYEIGKRLQKEGYGISDIGIRVKCDADIEQALQGYCDQIKVQS